MLAIYLAALDSADNAETTESGNNVDACALFAQDKLTINGWCTTLPARSSTTRTLLRM